MSSSLYHNQFYEYLLNDPFVQRMVAYKGEHTERAEVDQVLYKYRSAQSQFFRDDFENLVARGNMYFSGQHEVNDPMDCMPVIEPGIDYARFKAKVLPITMHIRANKLIYMFFRREISSEFLKSAMHYVFNPTEHECREFFDTGFECGITNEGVRKISMYCLTEDNNNDAMWAMYASQGNGVCVGLSQWSEDAAPDSYQHPIRLKYGDDRFVLNFEKALTYFAFMQPGFLGNIDENLRATISDNMDGLLYGLHKKSNWSFEQEYRLLLHDTRGYVKHPSVTVNRVYLGHKLELNDEVWIRTCVKSNAPSASLYRCRLSTMKYGYDFELLEE